jgi:hypothetical protein
MMAAAGDRRRGPVTRPALTVLACVALPACELREITFADAADVVVAEVVLHADERRQTAWLHRTAGTAATARVHGARVFIRDEERGSEFELVAAPDSLCLLPAPSAPPPRDAGNCHAADVAIDAVRPGVRYSLRVELPDRPPLRGSTTVPGAFSIVRPEVAACRIPEGTELRLSWTVSAGAWVYVTEARFTGLLEALRAGGTALPARLREPVTLLGLAIGAADTTVAFPGGFGLFDRGSEELHPLLVAIRSGLPAGVEVAVVVAAADRNYVNWVRGGSFNPSGVVRVPSVTGGGTGAFGSIVARRVLVRTFGDGPPCL